MNDNDNDGIIDLVNRYNALRQELASAKADNLALTQRNAALMSVLWSIEDWLDWHADDMRASGLLAQVRDALRNNK